MVFIAMMMMVMVLFLCVCSIAGASFIAIGVHVLHGIDE